MRDASQNKHSHMSWKFVGTDEDEININQGKHVSTLEILWMNNKNNYCFYRTRTVLRHNSPSSNCVKVLIILRGGVGWSENYIFFSRSPFTGTTQSLSPFLAFCFTLGYSLYGVFPGLLGQCISVKYSRLKSGWLRNRNAKAAPKIEA